MYMKKFLGVWIRMSFNGLIGRQVGVDLTSALKENVDG